MTMSWSKSVVLLLLVGLIFLTGCGLFFEDRDQKEEKLSVNIAGTLLDPVEPGSEMELICQVTDSEEDEPLFYSWSADGGSFTTDNEKKVTWVAPENSGVYNIEVSVENKKGNSAKSSVLIIVGNVDGLIFEHNFTLEGDMSNRPTMEVVIRNIDQSLLELDVMGTIFGNIACKAGLDEMLFEFIDYSTLKINDLNGNEIPYFLENIQILREDLDDYVLDDYFNIDRLQIETGNQKTIFIEYELVSNHELWEGFGGTLSDFRYEGSSNPALFWAVYLEWFIMRPSQQEPGIIRSNHLLLDLPSNWKHAGTYPQIDEKTIDLGELEYMRWNNQKTWKNYQRSMFVLFEKGPFLLETKEIGGTLVQDVYPQEYHGIRNHEANHQFFQFLYDNMGNHPMEKVLTFALFPLDHGCGALEFGNAYTRAPYSAAASSMGTYGTGGADLGHGGQKVDEPPKWSITREPCDEYSHLLYLHESTIRLWIGTLIKFHCDGGLAAFMGSQAAASYYTDWDVDKNRYERKYIFYLEEVVQDDGSEKEVYGVTGHDFHGYFKVSLAFFYLDQRIKEETGGQKSVMDAIQYIYTESIAGRNTLHVDDALALIVEALESTGAGGIDFEEKVKGFIFGDVFGYKFLDLSNYFDIDLKEYGLDHRYWSRTISY